jgi:branched-chain amino acid transport system substrate-binding protein
MRMKSKRLTLFIGVLFAVFTLSTIPVVTGTAGAAEPYKLGLVSSITGFMSPMGTGARDAAKLVVAQINKQGGINGHPIDLIIYDDGSDPSKGVMAYKKLIGEDKVLGIMGPVSTGIAMACAPIAEKAGVPVFSLNSSSWVVALKPWNLPNPPDKVRHWIFKAGIDPIFLYQGMFRILKEHGATKIAHMNVNNAMGKAMRGALKASHEKAGIDVVIWEEYGRQDTDLTVPLTKMKATNFDAIVISGAEMAGAIGYKQAREMGITKPIVGMAPLAMAQIVQALGKSLDGLMVGTFPVSLGDALPMDDPQRKPVMELTKLVRENTNRKRADTGHAAGWDGVYLFADALKRGNPDLGDLKKARTQVRDAFATIKGFVGTQSVGDVDKWHEVPAPYIPVKLVNGKFVIIGKKGIPSWVDMQ